MVAYAPAMGETAQSNRCLPPQIVPPGTSSDRNLEQALAIVSEKDDRSDQTLHPSQVA